MPPLMYRPFFHLSFSCDTAPCPPHPLYLCDPRYEGTLYNIDMEKATVALSQGQSQSAQHTLNTPPTLRPSQPVGPIGPLPRTVPRRSGMLRGVTCC